MNEKICASFIEDQLKDLLLSEEERIVDDMLHTVKLCDDLDEVIIELTERLLTVKKNRRRRAIQKQLEEDKEA